MAKTVEIFQKCVTEGLADGIGEFIRQADRSMKAGSLLEIRTSLFNDTKKIASDIHDIVARTEEKYVRDDGVVARYGACFAFLFKEHGKEMAQGYMIEILASNFGSLMIVLELIGDAVEIPHDANPNSIVARLVDICSREEP
jgi:hypothetical protein